MRHGALVRLDLKFIRLDYVESTRMHSKIDSNARQRAKMLYQFSGNSGLAIYRLEITFTRAIAFTRGISSQDESCVHVILRFVFATRSMFFAIVSVMT